MDARISVITLGVEDVSRARAFYEALGFPLSGPREEQVAHRRRRASATALRQGWGETGR